MCLEELLNKNNIKDFEMYGNDIAKVKPISKFNKKCNVILVTATNPTKFGEGKTTVAIGLHDALRKLNVNSALCLREPSMGPVFGIKGGATGGGKARILPEDKINLHFTGDFHAITSANNLICACIDNEIYQGNSLDIKEVTFNRCMDMNDRALRDITLNCSKYERKAKFDITAASEIMGIFCLAKDIDDLRKRISNIIIGYNSNHEEIYVSDLGITDAVVGLLLDAFKPNIVRTNENNLSFVHGGPFANIAHGCNSLISLETASNYGDYIVTEAGFGSDAGGFKFIDILARDNFNIYGVVLVTTIRALKYNGNGDIKKGISNLQAHIDNLTYLNTNLVVTLNKFDDDTDEDVNYVKEYVESQNILVSVNTIYQDGSNGAIDLARKIISFKNKKKINYLYNINDNLEDKINSYLHHICHATGYTCTTEIKDKINYLNKYKYPICVAKTQYSISDNPKLLGYPKDYQVSIKDIKVNNGSKFIVVYLGNIITMPGLSKEPSAKKIRIENNSVILPR